MMITRLGTVFHGILIGFLSIIGMMAVEAATIQGQVTDKDTGVQIEGAAITLHAAPGNGPAVQTESSNLFGLYRFDDAAAGSWVIKATRQGYSDATAEVSLSTESATANIALERIDGLPGSTVELITLTTVVVDAKSNYPIPNLPVTLFRYDDAADTTPDTVSAITDANGSAEVRVTEPGGFYDFAVNQNGRSGWESYHSSQDIGRTLVDQSHLFSVQLKHIPQDLKVTVRGCDPSTQEEMGLGEVYVELTGVDPDDHDLELVAKRTGLTDENGDVTFADLCPLDWKVRTIRYGYESVEEVITPDGSDQLADLTLTIPMDGSGLGLTLMTDYLTSDLLEGIEVIVEGIAETNTEGIRRTLDMPLDGGDFNRRPFPKLLPGRYLVTVNDTYEPEDRMTMPAPHFTLQEVVEVVEGQMTEVEVFLETTKVLVRGTLYESQPDLSKLESSGDIQGIRREPVYKELQQDGVALVASAEFEQHLRDVDRKVLADTNEVGAFAAEVLPGIYGIGIESLTEHYGSHVAGYVSERIDENTVEKRELNQEWPMFETWSQDFQNGPPIGLSGNPGLPLPIHSNGQYDLNLYVHPKKVSFFARIADVIAGVPTENRVQSIMPDGEGGYDVTTIKFNEAEAEPVKIKLNGNTVPVKFFDGMPVAEFLDLGPGAYTWTGEHPRFNVGPKLEGVDVGGGDGGGNPDAPDLSGIPGLADGSSPEAAIQVLEDLAATLRAAGAIDLADQWQARADEIRNILDLIGGGGNPDGNGDPGENPNPDIDPDRIPNGVTLDPCSTTFTVPAWPAYPGKTYPTDPSLAFPYQPTVPYQLVPTPNGPNVQYKHNEIGETKLIELFWFDNNDEDPNNDYDEDEHGGPHYRDAEDNKSNFIERTVERFDFIRPDYAQGALFTGATRPLGGFTYWAFGTTGRINGNGDVTITTYEGGPSNNTDDFVPPTFAGRITIRAVNSAAPDHEISGIEVYLVSDRETAHVTGTKASPLVLNMPQAYQGRVAVEEVMDPEMKWIHRRTEVVPNNAWGTDYTIVVTMERGVRIKGNVKQAHIDKALEGVTVRGFGRFGYPIPGVAVTDENGDFAFPEAAEDLGVFFLEYSALGFQRKRVRYEPNDPAFVPSDLGPNFSDLCPQVLLQPLPLPDIEANIDRFGAFMPYVSAEGKNFAGPIQAETELTATWDATTTAEEHEADVIAFDLPNGQINDEDVSARIDPIKVIALVDPRIFPEDPSEKAGNGADGALGDNRRSNEVIDFLPPDEIEDFNHDVQARRQWWEAITSQNFSEVEGVLAEKRYLLAKFSEEINEREGEESGQLTAKGTIALWGLHPGKFNPYVVIETLGGAISIKRLFDEDSEEDKILRGLRTPKWLSWVADFMALAQRFGGSESFKEHIKEITPDGQFVPLPNVTGEIMEKDGFLFYEYGLELLWKEGPVTPGKGFISMGLGKMGLELSSDATVTLDGKESKIGMEITGTVVTEEDQVKKSYLPKILPKSTKKAKFTVGGSGFTSFSETFNADTDPLHVELTMGARGGVCVDVPYDFKRRAFLIPKIGWLIAGLDTALTKTFPPEPGEPEPLEILMAGTGALGFDGSRTWTTFYPSTGGTNTKHPELTHVLGGTEKISGRTVAKNKFDLLFSLGGKASLNALNVVGGQLLVALEGDRMQPWPKEAPCGGGVPVLTITPTFSFWPLIKEAKGAVNVSYNVYLDVWITRFEKKGFSRLIKVDYQLGTQTIGQAIPVTNTYRVIQPQNLAPVMLADEGPHLLTDPIPGGVFKADSNGSGLLVYTDADPGSGDIRLQVSERMPDGSWGPSSMVANAAAIIAGDAIVLADGTWLAIWSTLAEEDISNLYPSGSTILSSMSADGGNTWTEPQVVGVPDKAVNRLDLISSSGITVALCGGVDNALGAGQVVYGTRYAGGAWSESRVLVPDNGLSDYAAIALGDEVVLAHVSAGQFHGVSWDGTGVPSSVVVAETAQSPIALTALSVTEGVAAYGIENGVGLARYTAAGWDLMDAHFQDQVAGDIALLTDGDNLHVALTDSGQVYHGILDSNGAVTRPMERLTGNNPGRYDDLQLSGSGDDVQLFTSYQSNIPQEIRDFTLPGPGEMLLRDSDGDGLDDIKELLIIDANSDDDIKRVSQVTAQDDFDGDGRSNGDEIAMGTDPTVADNPQDVGGERPSDRWLAENAPGRDWLDLAPSGRTYLEVYATSGQPTEVAATDDGTIQFSYTKPSDANVNYVLEVGDGEIWSAANGNEVSRVVNGDATETVTVQVSGEAPLARLNLILLP